MKEIKKNSERRIFIFDLCVVFEIFTENTIEKNTSQDKTFEE